MYHVYVLSSKDKERIYIGFTRNLVRRIKEHNAGHTKTTSFYRPWALLYSEEVKTRIEARNKEKEYKTASKREYFKNYLNKCAHSSVG